MRCQGDGARLKQNCSQGSVPTFFIAVIGAVELVGKVKWVDPSKWWY